MSCSAAACTDSRGSRTGRSPRRCLRSAASTRGATFCRPSSSAWWRSPARCAAATPEADLVQRFFEGIEKYSPSLVSWNGSGFDLPVLTYRALLAGLQAKRFWEMGDSDDAFRFNNYLNRYHWRHTDLMDVLSGFHQRNRVSLANMARLLGLPGKLGFHGGQVWEAWQAGDLAGIRRYCETDVLNT